MADSEKKVSVTLRRTYGYQGTYYGPGDAEVPQGLADALGLSAKSPEKPVSAPEPDAEGDADDDDEPAARKSGAKRK